MLSFRYADGKVATILIWDMFTVSIAQFYDMIQQKFMPEGIWKSIDRSGQIFSYTF